MNSGGGIKGDEAPNCAARLSAHLHTGHGDYRVGERLLAVIVDFDSPGTLAEAALDKSTLSGPRFVEWTRAPHIVLTRHDLDITSERPDSAFGLPFETSATASAMLTQIQGLCEVPVSLVSYRFG